MDLYKINLITSELDALGALEIAGFDLSSSKNCFNYMIIASGRSTRHASSLAKNIAFTIKKNGYLLESSSGIEKGMWCALDVGDIVVHIFLPELRLEYDLDGLWSEYLCSKMNIPEGAHNIQ
ncbi:MAG: ribosome silencing factor [Proteobacteria bacterium]|nr:ribosome silencing factor [Pseudomonadota bacterium]